MARRHCLVQRQRQDKQHQRVPSLLVFHEYAEKRNFVSVQAKNREFHNYVIERTVYHGILHQTPSENRCNNSNLMFSLYTYGPVV